MHATTPRSIEADARVAPERAASDTLTVSQLLLLAACEAFGFWVARPQSISPGEVDFWRWIWWQSLFGLSLAGPFVVVSLVRRGRAIGVAAHFWLMTGLGGWLFVPGMALARNAGKDPGMLGGCLVYTQSLVALWLFASVLVTGPSGLRKLWRPGPWSERFGLWLAVAWAPLGAWILVDLYRDAI